MKLSYSSISTYRTCPLKYRYRYLEKKPSSPSPALSFGQSIHEALRWFYDVPTPDPRPLVELLEHLDRCWVSEGYRSAADEVRYFYHARSILEVYHRNNIGSFRIPAALERFFVLNLGFCELSGVIDRVDKDPAGWFEVIDYKTNRRLPPARKLKEDLQLPVYSLAVRDIWDVAPERVTFHFLVPNHRYSVVVDERLINRALEEVQKTASSISAGLYDPDPNPLCPWCDYLEECPEMREMRLVKKASVAPPMHIGQAVDELVLGSDALSRHLDRMEGLKDLVGTYLRESGSHTAHGSRGSVSLDDDGGLTWWEHSDEASSGELVSGSPAPAVAMESPPGEPRTR